jgi:lipopolysaccharide/colanic/teichoic acid biosynthesis glycosyltransferase
MTVDEKSFTPRSNNSNNSNNSGRASSTTELTKYDETSGNSHSKLIFWIYVALLLIIVSVIFILVIPVLKDIDDKDDIANNKIVAKLIILDNKNYFYYGTNFCIMKNKHFQTNKNNTNMVIYVSDNDKKCYLKKQYNNISYVNIFICLNIPIFIITGILLFFIFKYLCPFNMS